MAQIAVINLTDVIKFGRFDADFFRADYLALRHRLEEIKAVRLEELLLNKVVTGHTPPMSEPRYYGDSVKFIKTDNLRENVIVDNFNHFLSNEGNERIKRSSLKEKDIIVTIIGASKEIVGRAALIENELLPANINQNIALIRVDKKKVAPEFLNVYLNTKSGRKYLHHLSRQTEQVNLNCREVEDLLVPVPDPKFQEKIVKLITNSNAKKGQSKSLYAQAEQLLLQELGLEDFTPEWVAGYETDFDNILEVSRMDAGYFQPKYKIIEDKVKEYKNGWDYLPKLIEVSKEKIKIEPENEYQYVELADINASIGIVDSTSKILGADLPSRAQMKLQKNDVVVSSVEGSIDKVGLILSEDENLVGSTGFHIFRSKAFTPEVNLILCKSPVLQHLFIREASGTILTAISSNSLGNISVPRLDKAIQEKITKLVQESHKCALESRQLLEQAKREVEEMIESKAN